MMKLTPICHRDCDLYQTPTGHLVSAMIATAPDWSTVDIVVLNADLTRKVQAYEGNCDCPAHKVHMQAALADFLQSKELAKICKEFDRRSVPVQQA